MKNLISKATNLLSSFLSMFSGKYFLAVILAGFYLLTSNVALADNNVGLKQKVRQQIEQNDTERPQTIGEWNQDARETENSPGERIKKIGQQSAEAFKEFGSGYVKGAKETASEIENAAIQLVK
jgi:hypothetical protein